MLDIYTIRQAYESKEVGNIGVFTSKQKLADGLS